MSTDTWEKLSDLRAFRGYKRVENYVKAVYNPGVHMRTDPDVSREDLEAYQIEVERKREQVEGFKTVERIIASRETEANEDVEYQHRKQCPPLSSAM